MKYYSNYLIFFETFKLMGKSHTHQTYTQHNHQGCIDIECLVFIHWLNIVVVHIINNILANVLLKDYNEIGEQLKESIPGCQVMFLNLVIDNYSCLRVENLTSK